jgi:hypothetical protein
MESMTRFDYCLFEQVRGVNHHGGHNPWRDGVTRSIIFESKWLSSLTPLTNHVLGETRLQTDKIDIPSNRKGINVMPSPMKTQELVDEIFKKIEGLADGDRNNLATALSLVTLKVLNEQNPPDLSESNKILIKENYPDATLQDMRERGLSEDGLLKALIIFNHASTIAVDYSPLTNGHDDQRIDLNPDSKRAVAQKIAEDAFSTILKIGYTPYGTAATMIMIATHMARLAKLSPFKLARCLVEAMNDALSPMDGGKK